MKKIIFATLMMMVIFTGCSTKTKETGAPEPAPTMAPFEEASSFYNEYYNSDKRPVAVMIDNDNNEARPHAGLEDAFLVYEVPVEGGSTRLMALYNSDKETAKIGPVRSSRHYFLDYVLEHNAIYVHFGYSPKAMNDIPVLGINNINGVAGGDGNCFWRESTYTSAYHTAYTSMENINKFAGQKGYSQDKTVAPLNFSKKDAQIEGENANNIVIPYAGFYNSSFKYDEKTSSYGKYINGSVHALQSGAEMSVKNIIIEYVKSYSLGDGTARINVDDVGSGKGYFATMGKYIPITWSKSSRDAKTIYKDESGNEIALNPGQTWIMIVPSSISVQID